MTATSRAAPCPDVLDSVGDGFEVLEAATRALIADSSSHSRLAPTVFLSDGLHDALLHLCEAPLTTASELAQLIRVPVSTLRDQLVKLSELGLADSRLHRLDTLGPRPHRRYFRTTAGIRALAIDEAGVERMLSLYPVSKQLLQNADAAWCDDELLASAYWQVSSAQIEA